MTTKIQFNKKILIMLIIAGIALPIQVILTSMYPASEYSFTFGVALAIFAIIVAIMIALYSKVRKEIPRE
ncbi:hypothetical protein K0U27_00920 [archaeon]|nr:hypothetical protein [archaeon]